MASFHAFIAEHIFYTLQNFYIVYIGQLTVIKTYDVFPHFQSWKCEAHFLQFSHSVHLKVAGVRKSDGAFESLTVSTHFPTPTSIHLARTCVICSSFSGGKRRRRPFIGATTVHQISCQATNSKKSCFVSAQLRVCFVPKNQVGQFPK